MSTCQYQPIQLSADVPYLRCVCCGQVVGPVQKDTDGNFLLESRTCPQPNRRAVHPLPNILVRIKNYAAAHAKMLIQGKVVLELPLVLERFRLCSGCEYYNDLEGACSICGCYVSISTDGKTPNKLMWGTGHCPDRPPKWDRIAGDRPPSEVAHVQPK